VGNAIGSGKGERAAKYIRQTVTIGVLTGGLIGAALFAGRGAVADLFNISPETRIFTVNIFIIQGATLWLRAANLIFFISMMRGGGDTRFAIIMDVGTMWLLGVPLALIGAFVLGLPVHWVYLLVMVEETAKFLLCVWRYRSKRWIHNLVSA
jgi:Na+-driven multidrug efflux pump